MSLVQTLKQAGVAAFGWTLPTLSPAWTTGTTPTVDAAALSLTLASGSWKAPMAGLVRVVSDSALLETLVGATGTVLQGPAIVLTLLPPTYLRLARLYAQLLEDDAGARPERAQGRPFRPVPKYFLWRGTVGGAVSGHVVPGDTLDLDGGTLTIHGSDGLVIDPLAVASAFSVFMARHQLLQHRPYGDAFVAAHQLKTIAALAGTFATHVRLSQPDGAPYTGGRLEGITGVAPGGHGVHALDGVEVTKAAAGGGFPEAQRRLLKFGHATTGRLTDGPVTFPSKPSGVDDTIGFHRDFFSLRVLELESYVIGERGAVDWADLEARPSVRVHEPVALLADGNDVLGAAAAALAGASEFSVAVAQAIEADFAVPAGIGAAAHWPEFPALPAGAAPASGSIDPLIRDGFAPSAHWIDDGGSPDLDVALTLAGLPAHAAVRVYNRRFVEDAKEARGDGAGGVAAADGSLTLRLRDPLGLAGPSPVIPTNATLRVDVIVVQRDGNARMFGNVSCPIGPVASASIPAGSNGFAGPTRWAVCDAAILGHAGHVAVPAVEPYLAAYQLQVAGPPRQAPRLPLMARRELLVAGLSPGTGHPWRAVLAAGRLGRETHGADPRRGAPGGPGGRETQVVGASTQRGLLAHDVARAAVRTAVPLVARLDDLKDSKWDEPAAPAELAADAAPSDSQGTFAGAVLQTIAPHCDSPELQPLHDDLGGTFPADLTALATFLNDHLGSDLPEQTALKTKLDALSGDAGLSAATKARLHAEVKREISTSLHGRRDAQWALKSAIGRARRFIYIETPSFGPTQKDYDDDPVPAYAADLVAAISARLAAASGLRVMICTPKHGEGPAGYEPMIAREVEERREKIAGLHSAGNANPELSRVVAFHPIGFPGRASRLESTVVIVDDLWLLIGGSHLRRRGLTFDGASDLVLADTNLVEGTSPAIAAFRRRLMASRLGFAAAPAIAGVAQPEPTFARLADGVEAFYAIRELLIPGGLGKIERLWNGHTEGLPEVAPEGVPEAVANPEGKEYDLAGTLALNLDPNFRF
ncbi:hypothetical protein [Nannocystis sp. SCPEA4]|uniref:hypothetical protein n=1 Tax=Nannocystis sp. SCPEA4 TaxID=2996787 RepID=UPI00226D4C83|nr:hypothetical protein [Nannocystis sp. SCPEA4]MCY1054688.1 hypothetical protein [Nannocystis sp. SCPEA4]